MGVLNVTPDSFSDGGHHFDPTAAIEHGLAMVAEGADLIDVGGESTRPGADRVGDDEEQRRVLPVIAALAREGVVVSVDTMSADTAAKALDAGASIINDVSGGLADPAMAGIAAAAGGTYIAMHWRGHSDQMQHHARYDDVVADVRRELADRIEQLEIAGVRDIVIDPGLGFAKEPEHNWALLSRINLIMDLGRPVLIGASRKRFLGRLLAADGIDRDVADREDATTAISALAAHHGAWAVRVHHVRASADAVRVADAWRRG
jgi:dihydropteroate synthase